MRESRAIVFDLDDTLYAYSEFVRSGFRAVAARLAVEQGLSAPAVVSRLGRARAGGEQGRELQVLCAHFGLPLSLVPSLVALVRDHVPSIRLPRTSSHVLASVRTRWRVGILTNGDPAVQRRKVRALGLERWVNAVVYAEECGDGSGKPAPDGFRTVLAQLGAAPRGAVFVGNDVGADIEGAAAIGMNTIHVDTPGAGRTRRCGSERCDAHVAGIPGLRHVPAVAERLCRRGV